MTEDNKKANKNLEVINKLVEFIKSPISTDDFSIVSRNELIKIIKELNFKYLELFFANFPQVTSISGIRNLIANNKNIWKMLSEEELSDLIKLIKKYGIKDEALINEIINSLAIYFIYSEALKVPKSPKITKIKNALSFLSFYQKEQIKLIIKFRQFNSLVKIDSFNFSDKKLKDFDKIPKSVFNLIDYIKNPKIRPHNPAINFFIAKITDAALKSNIKNNFVDFTIPILKELKNKYPDFFQEITSFNADYISNRAKEGRKLYSK